MTFVYVLSRLEKEERRHPDTFYLLESETAKVAFWVRVFVPPYQSLVQVVRQAP